MSQHLSHVSGPERRASEHITKINQTCRWRLGKYSYGCFYSLLAVEVKHLLAKFNRGGSLMAWVKVAFLKWNSSILLSRSAVNQC